MTGCDDLDPEHDVDNNALCVLVCDALSEHLNDDMTECVSDVPPVCEEYEELTNNECVPKCTGDKPNYDPT